MLCVNGDLCFLWESQKFDPLQNQKFGTLDYVGEETRYAKFYANPSKWGFPANG